jgi:hypothetical protein
MSVDDDNPEIMNISHDIGHLDMKLDTIHPSIKTLSYLSDNILSTSSSLELQNLIEVNTECTVKGISSGDVRIYTPVAKRPGRRSVATTRGGCGFPYRLCFR